MVKVEGINLSGDMVEPLAVKKFTIVTQPEYKDIKFQDNGKETEKRILVMQVKLHDNDMIVEYSPNRNAVNALMAMYGVEMDDWQGKEAEFKIVEQNVFGTIRKVLYIK